MRPVKLIFIILLIVGAGYLLSRFLDANREIVQLQFMLWRSKQLPLGILVTASFALGLVLSSGILVSSLLSKTFEARRLHRENEALQRLLETKSAAGLGDSAS